MEEQSIVSETNGTWRRRSAWIIGGAVLILVAAGALIWKHDLPFGRVYEAPAALNDIRIVSGTVTAAAGNRITLRPDAGPPGSPTPADRTVVLTASTTIFQLSLKDPKIFRAETDAFMRELQSSSTTPPIAPVPFARKSVAPANITVGSRIIVTAFANIAGTAEFPADEILIKPPPAAAPASSL